jgi:serine/threonine-protein phosphatase 2A regulatory subunit B'
MTRLTTAVRPEERNELFLAKLHQCKVIFDFNDASSELHGKQVKAETLHEMLEYITSQRGVITEAIYPEVVSMVSLTSTRLTPVLCQPLPLHTSPSESHRRRL